MSPSHGTLELAMDAFKGIGHVIDAGECASKCYRSSIPSTTLKSNTTSQNLEILKLAIQATNHAFNASECIKKCYRTFENSKQQQHKAGEGNGHKTHGRESRSHKPGSKKFLLVCPYQAHQMKAYDMRQAKHLVLAAIQCCAARLIGPNEEYDDTKPTLDKGYLLTRFIVEGDYAKEGILRSVRRKLDSKDGHEGFVFRFCELRRDQWGYHNFSKEVMNDL
ncbi:hypothetical protein BDV26DRAFT_298007 [Aspergillus bertholletiae]|uniref:Uncharacterized protein n=1 Tax=Aspergillus bertholletiae TaxID=1226010 RepID=A0A5N7AR03_9EURO|nr:hypothetical protein BDV26DRAFT_298007 [Aspergillus bertholletiae]